MSSSDTRHEALAAGLALAVAMGFGRFAFTGMYPLMVQEGVMSVTDGSYAASANYAGYLIGALLASRLPRVQAGAYTQMALLATVLSLAILAWPAGDVMLIAVRFLSGVFSAVAMVCASAWLLHLRARHHGAPLMYAGVGAGIAISAEILVLGRMASLHSAGLWLTLAGAAALFTLLAWRSLRLPARPEPPAQVQASGNLTPWQLIACYGLAGFGYIITATYLPLFVREALGHVDPAHIWAVFGLGAVPSCFLWHALNQRWGTSRALRANLLVQAVGVILPVLSPSAISYVLSALLVGGTFMGTATIIMSAARGHAHTLFARLTAAYGVGQIAGPLLSSELGAGQWRLCLMAAALALVLAAAAAQPFRRAVAA